MTELEKELTIKVKRLEDDCKAYNFTQHTLQEKIKELEEKLANADYQLEGRDLEIKELKAQIEKMKCCGNCAFQLVIGGVRDSHCVKCNACSEWELTD